MDEAMTHERCSELLRGHVLGDLPRDLADEVRAHLDECEECRAEERAVSILVAGAGQTAPLDELERARLHRGLAQELFTPRANADVASAAGGAPRWTKWVAPALATAAVLAGIAVMTTRGGSSDETATQQLSAEGGGDTQEDHPANALDDSAASGGGAGGLEQGADAERSNSSTALGAAAPAPDTASRVPPQFDAHAGSLTTEDLSRLGRSGDLFQAFAAAYRPGDGKDLYEPFLETLVDESPGLRGEIEQCAATLPRDGSLIPVYGALADYDGRDALVLGFVTSDPGSAELDRYLIWVWERGKCEQPIDSLFENIER
jgi:anti-sigma factor RsiW